MEREIIKVTKIQKPFISRLKIELDGTVEEIANAVFELVEEHAEVRRAFGKLCEAALINTLEKQLKELAI